MIHITFPLPALLQRARLTERSLAILAQVSRGCLRSVSAGDESCSLSSIAKIAEALGQKVSLIVSSEEGLSEYSIVAISLKIERDGFDSWKIHLMEFVDEFRRSLDGRLIILPPLTGFDKKLTALLASTVASLCFENGLQTPEWTRKSYYLPSPWFLSGMQSLKASAILESPLAFRRNNIFVQDNFLERA